jgi:hypothetical protein
MRYPSLFDCVAETHAVGRHPEPQKLIQLIARSDVEIRAEVPKERDDGVVGVGLDGVVDDCPGKVGLEVLVIFPDDVQIDDQTRCFFIFRKFLDALEFLSAHVVFEWKGVGVFH